MTTPLQNAIRAAVTSIKGIAGRTATFTPHTGSAISDVPVVITTMSAFAEEALGIAGVTITGREADLLVDKADLDDRTPRIHDEFLVDGQIYMVVDFVGLDHWEWVDSGMTRYRIHTRRTTN